MWTSSAACWRTPKSKSHGKKPHSPMQGVRLLRIGEGSAVPVDLGGVRLIRHRNSTQFFQGLFQLGPGKVVPPGGVLGCRPCCMPPLLLRRTDSPGRWWGSGSQHRLWQLPGCRLLHSAFGIPGGGRGFPQQGFQLLEGELSGQVLPAALHSRRQGPGLPRRGADIPGPHDPLPSGRGSQCSGFRSVASGLRRQASRSHQGSCAVSPYRKPPRILCWHCSTKLPDSAREGIFSRGEFSFFRRCGIIKWNMTF